MRLRARTVLALGALVILAIPPVVFLGAALQAGLSLTGSFSAMSAQYTAPRQNLLVCGAVGLLPLALLAVVIGLMKRFAPRGPNRAVVAIGGLLPVLAVLLWVNWDFWPLFLPDRTYPGFPHGLGFVTGPLIFAPIGMAVGMLISWFAGRKDSQRR
ncbi:MAG: hypothetical protein K0U98_11685 [Deltaproteobacteria bacterium]|nr:hypothetical protein [Deltaproteobacteria bacterium]